MVTQPKRALSTRKGQRTDRLRASNWQCENKNRRECRLASVGFLRMRDENNVPYKSQPARSGGEREILFHIQAFFGYLSFAHFRDISYHYPGNAFPACTETKPSLLALVELVASSVIQRGQTISQPHTHVRLLLQGQKLYLAILKQVHTIQLKAFQFLPSA